MPLTTLPEIDGAGPASRLGQGQQWGQDGPLSSGQIAGVWFSFHASMLTESYTFGNTL